MKLKLITLACVCLGTMEIGMACSVNVNSVEALQAAIDAAEPGSEICLAAGNYDVATAKNGTVFFNAKHGKVNQAITLRGLPGAVLSSSGGNYGMHIFNSSYIKVENLAISDVKKAVMLDGSSHVSLERLDISRTAEEAVHFRSNSKNNVLIDSKISHTGVDTRTGHKGQGRFGEAVYVGSAKSNWKNIMGSANTPDLTSHTCMSGNRIGPFVSAEAVDVKEGSSYTYILSNTFDLAGISGYNFADSALDLKGDTAFVGHNTFLNSAPTYLEHLYRIASGNDVPITTPGKVNGKITPDAIQTHIVASDPKVGSGSNGLIWNNRAELKSATRPAGYQAGMLLRIDDDSGQADAQGTRLCSSNSVGKDDVLSNIEAVACQDAPAIKACPAVLSLSM